MSFRHAASEVGISPTTFYNKVKKLERSGVLKGYIPIIDSKSIGYDLIAIIALRVKQENQLEVQKVISQFPQVGAIYENHWRMGFTSYMLF